MAPLTRLWLLGWDTLLPTRRWPPVGAIQPSHPLLSPSPPAFNLSLLQGRGSVATSLSVGTQWLFKTIGTAKSFSVPTSHLPLPPFLPLSPTAHLTYPGLTSETVRCGVEE